MRGRRGRRGKEHVTIQEAGRKGGTEHERASSPCFLLLLLFGFVSNVFLFQWGGDGGKKKGVRSGRQRGG